MMRYRSTLVMLACMLMGHFSFGQISQVKFEQIDSLQKVERRPVVVFLHTSWCKYCASMKNTTFKNKDVQELLNKNFYFLSLDIEEKRAISFLGHTFKYKPTGVTTGVHELAAQLGTVNGELAYPTTCFLDANHDIMYQQGGFIKAKELLAILKKLH